MQEELHTAVTRALVALGGNLPSDVGAPAATLAAALDRLAATPGDAIALEAVSRFYRTPAFPPGNGPEYVNAVCVLRFRGTAQALLDRLHAVEAAFGRNRAQRWGQRTLDLDLLDFGGAILPDLATFSYWRDLPRDQQMTTAPDRLVLPHPRLHERGFVLIPLADVAPGWHHPVGLAPVAEMVARLDPAEIAEIRAIGGTAGRERVVKPLSSL